MKSFKKLSFVALAAILSISFASAQIGIQAGWSTQTRSFENSWFSESVFGDQFKLSGFHVGPVADLKIQGPISLQYGLFYNYMTATKEVYLGNLNVTSHSLDLPVRVKAKIPFSDSFSAFVFAGPNFNYAVAELWDVNKSSFTLLGQENQSIYTWKNSDGSKQYAPFDLQLGAGAGLQYKALSLRFSYDFGMLDKDNYLLKDGSVWKNNDMKIGLAVSF